MTMSKIKSETANNIAGRLNELMTVKVNEYVYACGCSGRSDGSNHCSTGRL